jgi:hypothetical protein
LDTSVFIFSDGVINLNRAIKVRRTPSSCAVTRTVVELTVHCRWTDGRLGRLVARL